MDKEQVLVGLESIGQLLEERKLNREEAISQACDLLLACINDYQIRRAYYKITQIAQSDAK